MSSQDLDQKTRDVIKKIDPDIVEDLKGKLQSEESRNKIIQALEELNEDGVKNVVETLRRMMQEGEKS